MDEKQKKIAKWIKIFTGKAVNFKNKEESMILPYLKKNKIINNKIIKWLGEENNSFEKEINRLNEENHDLGTTNFVMRKENQKIINDLNSEIKKNSSIIAFLEEEEKLGVAEVWLDDSARKKLLELQEYFSSNPLDTEHYPVETNVEVEVAEEAIFKPSAEEVEYAEEATEKEILDDNKEEPLAWVR